MYSRQTSPASQKNHYKIQRKIHVLHLVSGDLWAGAEVMLYTLAKTLHQELNTKVSVIILNVGTLEQKLSDCGIPVFLIDESSCNAIQILRQLNRIIVEIQPDVIHTHRIKENILGSIVAWKNGRIPSLRTVHGASEHRPPLYKPHKHILPTLNWLYGRYYQRYIVAVSPDLAEKLKPAFQPGQVKTIENGIDIDSLAQSGKKLQKRKKNHYRIGIAGRLVPVKRVDLFIQTAIYLKQHQPELVIDFCIYGDGPLSTSLKQQVKNSQAESYIHFEGHCNDISARLQTLDVLLMTSDHEGLPMILLEAMCLKVPIIAHAIGGIPHLLDQGRCGVLIHEHQPEAFAEAIFQLLTHPEQTENYTQQAFERVNQHYSARQAAEKYRQLYNQACSKYPDKS